MAHKSKYTPNNPKKYLGNVGNIICRSTWERALAKWADKNRAILKWGLEYVIIPYYDKGSGRSRRYYTDFYFEFKDGTRMIIEVKPFKQTLRPKKPQRITRPYVNKVQQYATNQSKWNAAKIFCEERDMVFQVWTENQLTKLGLKVI